MLDRTVNTPKDGQGGDHSPAGDWQPLDLETIAPERVAALNGVYHHLSAARIRLARTIEVTPRWRTGEPAIAEAWTLAIGIDEGRGELILPEKLLARLLAEIDPALQFSALPEGLRALLVEYGLRAGLEAIEAALGWRLTIRSASPGSRPLAGSADALSVSFVTEIAGGGQFWCALRLDPERLMRLSGYLRTLAEKAHASLDMPLPVRLRWALSELTLAELRGLKPGDIVLVDASCPQPGLAVAVIGEHLVAPVELSRAGYRFGSAPRQAHVSNFGWSLDRRRLGEGGEGALGSVPLRVFFEYGSTEVSRSMAAELRGGSVLGLARPLEEGLDIVAGGLRIGRGEPITIGNAVGVRVTRI